MRLDQNRAEEAARELLLRQNPPKLPIRADKLRFERSIIIGSMKQFCRITSLTLEELAQGTDCLRDGCTLVLPGPRYVVLYNGDSRSLRRRNFTLAHELGHIYLNHSRDEDAEEREANRFAAELIMPRILAAELLKGLPSGQDPAAALAESFFVSADMARVQLSSIYEADPATAREKALLERYGARLPRVKEPLVTF